MNESKSFQRKDSCIVEYDYKNESSQKVWVDKGSDFAGQYKKTCKAEGVQVYSTLKETKVAFAAQTIRSLKLILHLYLKDYGSNYI